MYSKYCFSSFFFSLAMFSVEFTFIYGIGEIGYRYNYLHYLHGLSTIPLCNKDG